jgi:hypothetical protein
MELMVTVCFVMLGTMVLQGGFVRAANMFGRYENTLRIGQWLNEASAAARGQALYTEEGIAAGSGTANVGSKDFDWKREVESPSENLFAIRYTAQWTESGRPFELKRESYAFKKDLPQR